MLPALSDRSDSLSAHIDGHVAAVTGAGRGLGRATALALAQAGAKVALIARSESQLEETKRLIHLAGGEALVIPADLAAPGGGEAAINQVAERAGAPAILVNNAGGQLEKPLLGTSSPEWRAIIDLNLGAVLECSRAAAAYMRGRGEGKIVNVASIFGLVGVPRFAVYSASKAGVVGLTRALAAEWARYGITVNAVAPGYFSTDMTAGALADEGVRRRIVSRIPLRRVGQAAELGALVRFLASPAAGFITGQTIAIDGGVSAT